MIDHPAHALSAATGREGGNIVELTERKKKVLRSVVDLYIRTAEPVGSKAITELPDMK